MSEAARLTEALIARRSVTPHDAGCQALLAERLSRIGFECEWFDAGPAEHRVTNLYARRDGAGPGTTLAFAGHTDVVPAGPLERWASDPFVPTYRNGALYGRGAADMKTSIAAMVVAAEEFVAARPRHSGRIAFLLTSDEEGPAVDGTAKVIETLEARQEKIRWCLVGEPSSQTRIGDTVKNGRRGSLGGHLIVRGTQGHVAYPHLADNPIHRLVPVLDELTQEVWDQGNAYFPPTSFQISNINAGTGATNVIPASVEVAFNLRYSSENDERSLRERIEAMLTRHDLDYELAWQLSGKPFLTRAGELIDATQACVRETLGYLPQLSTTGGTSDGRFVAPTGAQVLELGLVNETIHKVDECVRVTDLDALTRVYYAILRRLLGH
jgi:succinyl-diaminopimelate desuccinylase